MYKEGDRLVTGHRLIKFLGRGNFGEVWQASAPGNTNAALKFLNLEQTQGRREYRAIQPLKNLRHANLLQMTAIWLLDENGQIIPDDEVMDGMLLETVRGTLTSVPVVPTEHRASTLIIAMPFADKSLDKLLHEYKMQGEVGIPRDELLRYMEDAAKAIDYLNKPQHDFGQGPTAIRHCDVKPENLLLMGQSVVLCDFGVSRPILEASTARKTSMGGSLAYMAPECLSDEVTEYSDQFSLAISYLELRTGKLPFENMSQAAVMDQRRRGVLDLGDLPKAEARVIAKATSVKPNHRYASAQDMVSALYASIEAPPAIGWWKVAVGGAVVASLAGAAIWFGNIEPDKSGGSSNNGSNGGIVKNDDGSERTIVPEPVVTPKTLEWKELEQQAFSLMDSQWDQARDKLAESYAARPETDLSWPGSLYSHRSQVKKALSFRWPFVPTTNHAVYALTREKDLFTLGKSHKGKFESALTLRDLESFGSLDGELLAIGRSVDSEALTVLSTAPNWQLPSEARIANDDWVNLAFADGGDKAALVNWTKQQLVSLDKTHATLKLPDIGEKRRSSLLSDDGQWIAAFVVPVHLYVGKLDGSMEAVVQLSIGSEETDDFAVSDSLFSFQTVHDQGYVTLKKKNDDGLYFLQLLQFSLSNPQEFKLIDLTPHLARSDTDDAVTGWSANYAQLEARDDKLMLAIGSKSKGALVFTDLPDLSKLVEAPLADGVVDCCSTLSGAPGQDMQRWMVWSTENRSLYLQPLEKDAVGVRFATSHRQPVRMYLTGDRLIVGFSNGDFDVYDFEQLRLMYSAAIKAKKINVVKPSSSQSSTA